MNLQSSKWDVLAVIVLGLLWACVVWLIVNNGKAYQSEVLNASVSLECIGGCND